MTRSSTSKASQCHVLNFFYDDEDGCALTVFVNGVRFHIIADAERLKARNGRGQQIEQEYRNLLSAVKDEVEEDEEPEKFQQRKEFEAAEMHKPDHEGNDSQDSGHGTSDDEENDEQTKESDSDSAVDVSEEKHEIKELGVQDNGVILGERYAPEAEKSIQNWMLAPFKDIFDDLAPASKTPENQTLEDWYRGPAHFFNLEIDDDQLSSSREESSEELNKRMIDLIPSMPIPKYIKELGIPFVQAKDITVLEEGTEPEPYHPTRVKVNDEIQFLKVVNMSEHAPVKREIKLLKEAEDKGLHEKIHIPRLLGLAYEKSKSQIMGFLQTDIEEPTPLTRMLDSDVVEDNREKWAKETKRIIDLLHENDIIWGDAKADNFMVDKHGELWIIDFGGSYTDGWVDPELMETQEGDDMGTEKIVNALEDPEANTYEPGAEEVDKKDENNGEAGDAEDAKVASKKRSCSEDGEEHGSPSKRRK